MHYDYLETPIGILLVAGEEQGLHCIGFADGPQRRRHHPEWFHEPSKVDEALRQLRAYFVGELREFSLPLHPLVTEFQQRVLHELGQIPYGETRSYAQIANAIGQPTASRAVGMANGRNPIPVVIPCHRVIGSKGDLRGFGGGVETKRWLLEHEQAYKKN